MMKRVCITSNKTKEIIVGTVIRENAKTVVVRAPGGKVCVWKKSRIAIFEDHSNE